MGWKWPHGGLVPNGNGGGLGWGKNRQLLFSLSYLFTGADVDESIVYVLRISAA